MQMQFSICNNVQNNMQTLNPIICKILTSLYFAYFAYICTAQFADDIPVYTQAGIDGSASTHKAVQSFESCG